LGIGSIAPGLANIAGSASTGAGAAQGTIIGAGAAVGKSLIESGQKRGFLLFVAAGLVFAFSQFFGVPSLYGYLSLFFMLYSAFFIFRGQGSIVVIFFVVWYFLLGRADITQLGYSIIPIILIAGLMHGVIGVLTKKEGFALSGGKEMLIGAVHVLIFFLDIGIVEYYSPSLNWGGLSILIPFLAVIPLWAYVGLVVMMSDDSEKSTIFNKIAIGIGILYLVSILVLVPSGAYGQAKELVPGMEEFVAAKQNIQGQLPKVELPSTSNLRCLIAGRFTDLQACITDRQLNSELKSICISEGYEEGSEAYNKCITEQKEIRKQGPPVSGTNDPTIKEPTTTKFVVGQYFPTEMTHDTGTSIEYPINLEITNPRKQNLTFEFSCNFTNKKDKTENFQGTIISGDRLEFSGENPKITVICQSPSSQSLNGSYDLIYHATIKGLSSSSKLQRAFIGDRDDKWKEEWVPKIMAAHFSGSSRLSQGAPDFARINFGYGNTIEDPIVESKYGQTLSSSIENLGNGRIINVYNYKFEGFEGFGNLDACTYGEKVHLPSFGKSAIPLKPCFTKTIPSELSNPRDYVLKEFEATIVYDYLIERNVGITVNLVTT